MRPNSSAPAGITDMGPRTMQSCCGMDGTQELVQIPAGGVLSAAIREGQMVPGLNRTLVGILASAGHAFFGRGLNPGAAAAWRCARRKPLQLKVRTLT